MCQAFPDADYYGVSVTLGVAPGRQSRVSSLADVQGGLGAPFVSLRSLEATLLPEACSSGGPNSRLSGKSQMSPAVSESRLLQNGHWGSSNSAFTMPPGPRPACG